MDSAERSSGILLACSSLPSPYGIGSFGEAAREWTRFLRDSAQRYWQILPLGVTGWGDSPYQSFSAFAMSPYYIDLDTLERGGLLRKEEYESVPWGRSAEFVNYAALYRHRRTVLGRAFERFSRGPEFEGFCAANSEWLDDYALFMALKSKHRGRSWSSWEDKYRLRSGRALERFAEKNSRLVDYYRFEQFEVFGQWKALRDYAASLGVQIIGDMPIYVAEDSADVWAAPELFELDGGLRPVRVAGCPPDPFSASGQLWGNPLYLWERHKADGFSWWIKRLRRSFELFDVLRIDHFRGLESYYAIPAGEKDARGGVWVKGPDKSFIDAVKSAVPDAKIIAEDLGYLSPELKALLEYSGYPGMKVLQFAFDSRESGNYMPHTYSRNCVVYSGTHDNTTSAGWFRQAGKEDVALALDYFGLKSAAGGHDAFIRTALSSVARLAVIPMQDYLGLGEAARTNTPSSTGKNWRWRLRPGLAAPELASRIRRLSEIYGRANKF